MPYDDVFDTSLVDYHSDFEKSDVKNLQSLPHSNREKIPFVILKNTAYQLVLDKYLQLFELCWKYNDEEGNNQRFAEHLNYNNLKIKDIDVVADYLVNLPLDNPSMEIAEEFYRRVYMGELEFACRMHIINGYTAFDFAQGFYNHYNDGTDLVFNKRYKFEQMIFLPE